MIISLTLLGLVGVTTESSKRGLPGKQVEGLPEGELLSVGFLAPVSQRNAICSKYWHLGKSLAAAPDLDRRLRLSRHFCNMSLKFFNCFCRNTTEKYDKESKLEKVTNVRAFIM